MLTCPACLAEVGSDCRVCPQCGLALDASDDPTATPSEVAEGTRSRSPSAQTTKPTRSVNLPSGTILAGRYRIETEIGRGGMAVVFRAKDLDQDREVAVKVLPADADSKVRTRFQHEADTARRLSHLNICRVTECNVIDGHLFMAMDLVDGENLKQVLSRTGRLSYERALDIARQLCAALSHAHGMGIVHRDLKPANVLIDRDGRVRVSDFGLAGAVDEFKGKERRAGTPAYMSPEQLAGRVVTAHSDLYALGMILYELFTGRRPFDAVSPADFAQAHSHETPQPPSAIIAALHPRVSAIIMQCLQKSPADRPASADAVARSLPCE